ncbi:MAG: hypothetical protein IKW84_00070 [Bacteroidaceae bacterium]|nr:hypothetical protein [Bacteroidaceae bacterium]MBR5157966.1 hypothetical protein [Bacteroidaceae bacterium]
MKLTHFGKRVFALIILALIVIALIVGAVAIFKDSWHLSMDSNKAYNVIYMAVLLPVGIGVALKLKDRM